MENENKKNIPWFHRLCAFAVACAVCVSFCVLAFTVPRFRARADDTAWSIIGAYVASQLTYAALLDITSEYVSNNPVAAAIRGAEIAYAFMLVNSANPAITVTSGNSKYYGGYTYYNGDSNSGVYFGSGFINDDARSSRISVHTNTAEFPNSPASIVMNFQADVSSSREYRVLSGSSRGWSGTFFCAGYSPYVSEGILTSGVVIFLIFFVPILVKWVTWAFTAVYLIIDTVPEWVAPFFLVCVVLALVSLGVKLL